MGFASRNQTTLFSNLAQDNHLIVTKGAILMNRPNQDAVFSVPQALLPGFRCTTGVQCREYELQAEPVVVCAEACEWRTKRLTRYATRR